MAARVSRTQRDAIVDLVNGRAIERYCFETKAELLGMGLAEYSDGNYTLTDVGKALAEQEHAKREAARKERNKASRARHAAMRSLGLRRTAYGWE